jgi:hypothetical protein
MANEIVLSAATEYVATADIPELIAQALHPDTAGQQLTVSYFIKFAGPGATGETARWNGWPIDDDDRKVLDRIWADMPRLPDHPTSDEVQPYLEMANNAGLDWILDVCWNNPELTSTILRFDAEREHRKAIVSAVRNGALKVVAPHTRLPTDEYQPNSEVSVEELTRYVAQFTIAVRMTPNRDMASAAPQSARRQQTEQESPFAFPPKLLKLSLWDLACLHTGQNATDDKPTNETRHKLAELVQSVYGRKLWVEWPPGTDFDFVSGFVPTAANARVDTDWRELDRITVRREDWERYEDEMQRELAQRSELIQEQVTLWEHRQPANLFTGDGFSEELLQLTTLSKYLEFETWTPETAALLVSGIQAPIPCDEIPSKGAMGLDNCFIIGTQDPFHQARWVLELWRSRENPPIRVRPIDFIAWCKTKNIDTSWLRSVEENAQKVEKEMTMVNIANHSGRAVPIPDGLMMVTPSWLAREIAMSKVEIPDDQLLAGVKKIVPAGTGISHIEPLTGDEWRLVRNICGGNPPVPCSPADFEAYREKFDAVDNARNWTLYPEYRPSNAMQKAQIKHTEIEVRHRNQMEKLVRTGNLSLVSSAGIETTNIDEGYIRIADVKTYLEQWCIPYRNIDVANTDKWRNANGPAVPPAPVDAPDEGDLSLIGQTSEQWDQMTIEQRQRALRSIANTKRMAEQVARQADERHANGRYTLSEAAKAIAGTRERFETLEAKLRGAAEHGDLPMFGPGEQARYDYMDGKDVRLFYEEAHWDDLNAWLDKNEPRIMFRFPAPAPAPAATKTRSGAASIRETPAQYRQRVIAVLDKHNGNKTKAGAELGISRQRVAQLIAEKSQGGRAATDPNDPFNRTQLPRKKRT